MNIPIIAWERVFENIVDTKGQDESFDHGSKILRARVLGGWLVRALEISKGTVGFVFLPDPEYTWETT
jgi:hypothetical protein